MSAEVVIKLGSTIYIDGERFTCVSVSEVMDSDMGCGPVVKRTILKLENSYGGTATLSTEVPS